MEKYSSGAVRSERKLPWWMLPWGALRLIVQRYQVGQDKGYGIHNWKKAVGSDDVEFVRGLYDHLQEHLAGFLDQVGEWKLNDEHESPLDHLAATGWGVLALIEYTLRDRALVQRAFPSMPESSDPIRLAIEEGAFRFGGKHESRD